MMAPTARATQWAVRGYFVGYGLVFASWASRIPDIQRGLGLTDAELGGLLFSMPVGQLISLQISGHVATRCGSYRVVPLALSGYALMLLGLGMAHSKLQLGLALLGFGAFGNIASTSLQTQAVMSERQAERPLMAGFHGCWSLAGFAAGAMGLWITANRISPARHFFWVTGLFVLFFLGIARYLQRDPMVVKGPAKTRGFDRRLIPLGLIGFCSMGTEGCMFDWSGVYFRDVVQAPDSLVVLGYTAFMITVAGCRFWGDRMASMWGRVRLLQIGGVLMSLGLFLSVAAPQLLPATLAFILVGLGASNIVPTVYSLAGKSRPDSPATALASIAQISFLGFLLGPPMIGQVAGRFGLRTSFAIIACLGLLIPWLAQRGLPGEPTEG